jgi:hypothetical protein
VHVLVLSDCNEPDPASRATFKLQALDSILVSNTSPVVHVLLALPERPVDIAPPTAAISNVVALAESLPPAAVKVSNGVSDV